MTKEHEKRVNQLRDLTFGRRELKYVTGLLEVIESQEKAIDRLHAYASESNRRFFAERSTALSALLDVDRLKEEVDRLKRRQVPQALKGEP